MIQYESYENLAKVYKDSISEWFDSFDGTWRNYAVQEDGGNISADLGNQKHIDIRSFDSDITYAYVSVFDLGQYTMTDLKAPPNTVESLGSLTGSQGENWTSSTNSTFSIGPVKNSFWGIDLTCANGSTESPSTSSIQSFYNPINIGTLTNEDYLVVSLPDFSSSITTSTSYIDITSSNDFNSETDSFNFSPYIVSLNGSTNKELKIPIGLLTNVDLSNIQGIRFRITATASGVHFKCLSIRAISKNWKWSPVDFDTINKRLRKTPPNYSGASVLSGYFNDMGTLPTDWPVLQRAFSTNLAYGQNPKILNGELNAFLDIGNPTTSSTTDRDPNVFAIYFNIRQKSPTQFELSKVEGSSGKTQGDLTVARVNPSNYMKQYDLSKQLDYTVVPSTEIAAGRAYNQLNPNNAAPRDGKTQYELSKVPSSDSNPNNQLNPNLRSAKAGATQRQMNYRTLARNVDYIGMSLEWSKNSINHFNFVIKIIDAVGTIYKFDIPSLIATNLENSKIIFSPKIDDDYIQIKLYKLNQYNKINLVYQTEKLFNDIYFVRGRNRLGWYAHFADGDSYVNSIRSGGMVYAEYRAHTMKSRTPLKGINLFADYSANINLIDQIIISQSGALTVNSKILNVSSTSGLSSGDRINGEGIKIGTKIAAIVNESQLILDQNATVAKDTTLYIDTKVNAYGDAVLSDDANRLSGSVVTKISAEKGAKFSGIITDVFQIEDPNDVKINLDLWYPSSNNELIFILFDSNGKPLFNLEPDYYRRDRWKNINVRIPQEQFVSGRYKFGIFELNTYAKIDWWINNFTIKKQLITWEARSTIDKLPGYSSQNWIELRNNINQYDNGALFENKGTELQFRARAKSHYGLIHNIKVVPNYATLGNFVWREE